MMLDELLDGFLGIGPLFHPRFFEVPFRGMDEIVDVFTPRPVEKAEPGAM